MRSFSSYQGSIQESTANAFLNAKAAAKFVHPSKQKQYTDVLDLFATALTKGEIYNSDYKDNYSYGLSRNLETAVSDIRMIYINRAHEKDTYWNDGPDGLFSIQSIKKHLKHFTKTPKIRQDHPEMVQLLDAIKDLPDALKELKKFIVKGRKPKEVDPNAFVKPVPTRDAKGKADEVSKKAVVAFERDLRKSVLDSALKDFAILKKVKTKADLPKNENTRNLAAAIFITSSRYKDDSLTMKDNADAIVRKIATETVDNIISRFVEKNSSKLATIFAKKAVKRYKILRHTVHQGMLENIMSFEFEDGSAFILDSQVVYKYTSRGTLFIQFPTRFKSVKMADGTMMKMPSEEKMIKTF